MLAFPVYKRKKGKTVVPHKKKKKNPRKKKRGEGGAGGLDSKEGDSIKPIHPEGERRRRKKEVDQTAPLELGCYKRGGFWRQRQDREEVDSAFWEGQEERGRGPKTLHRPQSKRKERGGGEKKINSTSFGGAR